MIKLETYPKFNVEIIEVHEDRFVYKRDKQRDKWICYYAEALPDTLKIVMGKRYTGQNVITTENGRLTSWKRKFKEK